MDITTEGAALVLHGDFDVRSTWEVRNAIYERLEGRDEDVIVDMSGVQTIDLTALKVLAAATHRASRTGHRVTLRDCGPSVRRMLHLSGLARVLEVERRASA